MILKTSPTALLFGGVFPLTAEYRLMMEIPGNRKHSDQLGVSLLGKSLVWKLVENAAGGNVRYKMKGLRIQYAHKFYLVSRKGFAPHGFYFAPMVSYANARVSPSRTAFTRDVYYDFNNLTLNMLIGVQTGKFRRISMDIYAGPGYKNMTVYFYDGRGNRKLYEGDDFGPLFRTNLNFTFGINLGVCLY
jgi:hypothetical protein